MTPTLLRKIKALVEAGATVLGTPRNVASLTIFRNATRGQATSDAIWGDCDGTVKERRLGEGPCYAHTPNLLAQLA